MSPSTSALDLGSPSSSSATRVDVRPTRTVNVLRVPVVLSVAVLVLTGSAVHRTYPKAAVVLVALVVVYAAVVLVADLRGTALRQGWITGLDTVMTLAVVSVSGGADSRVVAVLPLAVVAAAVRQGLARALWTALGAALGYTLVVVLVPSPDGPLSVRVEAAAWWSCYLVLFAVMTGTLREVLDREHEQAVEARAEARADQLAFAEERDLRERLAQSREALDDGIRVLLHEFRTPVSSLQNLTQLLQQDDAGGHSPEQRTKVVSLVAAHARHLTQMLDQVAGLAISTGDPSGTSQVRDVVLADVARGAADAAGVGRLVDIEVDDAVVRCDEQRVRRILTNLLENAVKHGGADSPVRLRLHEQDRQLHAEVLDRGPGLPEGQEHLVTRKYVSIGEREGTTGLGLWIVEQLVTGMGGTLVLAAREGGGLTARVTLPLPG